MMYGELEETSEQERYDFLQEWEEYSSENDFQGELVSVEGETL